MTPRSSKPTVAGCAHAIEDAYHATQNHQKVTADDVGACRGLTQPQIHKAAGIALRDIFRESSRASASDTRRQKTPARARPCGTRTGVFCLRQSSARNVLAASILSISSSQPYATSTCSDVGVGLLIASTALPWAMVRGSQPAEDGPG